VTELLVNPLAGRRSPRFSAEALNKPPEKITVLLIAAEPARSATARS
jgi:hypothetical protein